MARPSILGMVPLDSTVDEAAAVASVLAAIPVSMAMVVLEVTLVASPPPVVVEELESAWKQALFPRQLVEGDMQLTAEEIRKTSSHKSHFLRSEYARVAELERRVESACRESRDWAAEAAVAWAEGQRVEERATMAEQGLEAARAHQIETEPELRASLANTEVALQEALAALDLERAALESAEKALEVERRARSEADREVLALRGRPVSELVALLAELGEKVEVLERDLETTKATLGRNTEELAKSHEECRALEGDLDQIHNVAQHVISEIFGSVPNTSAPAV
ncbi:uncharacterized protein [Miscanthus floridulus]|uniref:uncharacterized protein n=1 Tax=Miscanthus floridulus TaxID=154761 RepID=UPI00345906E6